jgi:hypothetical protein
LYEKGLPHPLAEVVVAFHGQSQSPAMLYGRIEEFLLVDTHQYLY